MARIEKLNCSNCGASLEVDPDAQVIVCRFCGTQLLLEVEKEIPAGPGIISQKHYAEVKQWLDKLGIDKYIDPLEDVYDLNLEKKEIYFPDLKYLAYLPNIRVLQMQDSNIDDNGTPYLKVLKELQAL
jgi:DNA-directed RNA polymerase subunit RPC12/RpoP